MFHVELVGDELVIRAKVNKQPSSTGKTTLLASTHGALVTGVLFEGKPIQANINVYVK
jgi:hypothetical protein